MNRRIAWQEMKRSITQSDNLPHLLRTSLHIPQLHEGLITRTILLDRVDLALKFPLILVCAPAGFGKTTLLSQWVAGRNELRGRVAWVSLESHCDTHRLWTYIITALEEIQAGIGDSTLTLLELPQPPIYTILRTLVNEIAEVADDLVLILDDFHHVDDPAAYSALTFFIDHLPSNLKLVIASRVQPPLPLARWRAGNQLYELREDDLRFNMAEVATFFNENKGLNLSTEEIAALEVRTEGWIAGLQLAALSMKDFDDKSKHNFVSTFTGSQRYILDFLVEEVLQRQPDHIKTFLLKTALLDRLNGSLCNATTGQADGQAILEHLERANMFTIALDQERQWYRYHHLFRDVLRHELQRMLPGEVVDLHRRAAAWYNRAGLTDDAIYHACTAHALDEAIPLIESVINTAWSRGEVRKIIEWLGKVPPGDLVLHPNLTVYYIRALLHGGQMNFAEQRLRETEAGLRARLDGQSNEKDRWYLGAICAFRSLIAAVSDEPASALELGHEALRLLPAEDVASRVYAINSLGTSHFYLGDLAEAVQALGEGSEQARKAGSLFPMFAGAAYQAEAMICQGQLKRAGGILQHALDQGEIPNQSTRAWLPAASYVCVVFSKLLYEWNRLEEAERYLTEAVELGQQLALGSVLWSAYHILLHIKFVHGNQEGALDMIQQATHYRHTHSLPVPARLMEAMQARACLRLGYLADAERWAHTCGEDQAPSPGIVREFEIMTLARLHLLQGRPGPALALLERLLPLATSAGHQGRVIEILMLIALAQEALGTAAVETLHAALKLAEPEGYVRIFVDEGQPMEALLHQALAQGVMPDYVEQLLAAFPANNTRSSSTAVLPVRAAASELIELLSERELEVLQLMAGGASNQDIAGSLIIAFTTAKKHVSNIIRKLGVDNRTQAVAKGRELGLVE
jgi:LuxR family transcriptional regulator, maltose regulon positive regulatory protein